LKHGRALFEESLHAFAAIRGGVSAKRRLLETCKRWLNEVGVDKLPEGIFDLRNRLEDERASIEQLVTPR